MCGKAFHRRKVNGQVSRQRFCSDLCRTNSTKMHDRESVLAIKMVKYWTGVRQADMDSEVIALARMYQMVKRELEARGVRIGRSRIVSSPTV